MQTDDIENGVCTVCMMPGVIGMRCNDPDCPGVVEALPESKEGSAGSGDRYDDQLLSSIDSTEADELEQQT